MHSLILCGGSGSRLWPLSRKNFPKQFLKLYSDKSLLQETFLRTKNLMPVENIFLITNQENFFNVYNQISEIEKNFNKKQILIEPLAKNTMPAITLGFKALIHKKIAPDEAVLILPADHYIKNEEEFLKIINTAKKELGSSIGTIGITPQSPETGFGYIKKSKNKTKNHFSVLEFKEKPNKETAEKYLKSGQYLWNSGMYILSTRAFVLESKKFAPVFYNSLKTNFKEFLKNFKSFPSLSFDVAISEKSNNVIVFEADFGWSDIGSFDNLAQINSSKNNVLQIESKNIFAHSTGKRLIATIGVQDLNIIETGDSILIHKQGESQKVKNLVNYLKENNYKELKDNIISYQAWGKSEILINTPLYKVKKVSVYPGKEIKMQAHYHRAEHWIVVRGVAEVVNGEEKIILKENQSTFIPALTKHSLKNPGKINTEIIEVQTGNYIEEDDIFKNKITKI